MFLITVKIKESSPLRIYKKIWHRNLTVISRLALVAFALALFMEPEKTVKFILKTLDKAVGVAANLIPALKGKERRNGADDA